MVAAAVNDAEAVPQASKAWEFFRSIGSPKYHVAPMVDQVEQAILYQIIPQMSPVESHAPLRLISARYHFGFCYDRHMPISDAMHFADSIA